MVAATLVAAPMDLPGRNWAWIALPGVAAVAAAGAALWLAFLLGGPVAAAALGLSLASPLLLWGVLRRRHTDQADRLGAVALLLLSVPWAFLEPVVSVVHVAGAIVVLAVAGRPTLPFPLRRRPAAAPDPVAVSLPERRYRIHRARILLVEDNPANRFYGSMVLRKLGHPFDVVASGEQAVAAVQERRYDVVLMDMRMPGMDGVETTAAIHLRVLPHLRPAIIALTADDRPETRQELLRQGMDGYLTKPLRPEALEEVLARMTGKPVVVAVR